MSEISPVHHPHAPTLDPKVRPSKPQASADGTARGQDQVQLSDKAQFLSKIAELPDVRQGLVDEVRASIADGSYETDDRINAAIDNLIEDIA